MAKYSYLIGLYKTAKNIFIAVLPSLTAALANVPLEYAWLFGAVAYFLKNFAENKNI